MPAMWNFLAMCDGRGSPRRHASSEHQQSPVRGAEELFVDDEQLDEDELVISASPATMRRTRRTPSLFGCTVPQFGFRKLTAHEMAKREAETAMEDHPLRLGSVLGTGEYSTVYEGYFGKTRVAVKVIQPHRQANKGRDCQNDFDDEVTILEHLTHPHCLQLLGTQDLTIVTEVAPGETLAAILYNAKQVVQQPFVLAHQLAACVSHIHSRTPSILHRDIKPENVMVDVRRGVLKLIDFGMAIEVAIDADDDGPTRTTFDGSPLYASPEALLGAPPSCASEVWSLGCVVVELFGAGRPFSGSTVRNLNDLTSKLRQGKCPFDGLAEQFQNKQVQTSVERCFSSTPSHRPTAHELAKVFAACVPRRSVVEY